jgi:hypothetical protein
MCVVPMNSPCGGNFMRREGIFGVLAAGVVVASTLLGGSLARADDAPDGKKAATKPVVQIAVLLDTSGSMRGLIDQAKSQLWRIVNEFTHYKRGDLRPDVYVSLYHYGSPSLGADNGFVKQVLPLTLDLDRVSDELFRLTINGGDEYCGAVIDHAVEHLAWSNNDADLRLIFVAGNEPFDQGHVPFVGAVEKAVKKGIIVNTIFCGNEGQGISTHWKAGADIGGGAYAFIDHNQQAVHIDSPQDKALVELSAALNKTYIPFGAEGMKCADNQVRQDNNALSLKSAAAVERAATKASSVYVCSWDLIDASKDEKFDWKSIKSENLPEEYRKLSIEELKAKVKERAQQRETLQTKIRELQVAREAFVAAKMRELAKEGEKKETLEIAIISAIRKQAEAKSFVLDAK